MKKLVNGRVVDIKNIELFELAAEGLALQNTTISTTRDGIRSNINSAMVSKYIKEYDLFFTSIPYPLYAIEADIKYATLGNFIKALAKTHIDMWVNKGLHINLDRNTGMTLRIVNNTWSIEYIDRIMDDNTSLKLFHNSVGYAEYSWVLNKIINNERTSSFYEQFMPDFVRACNNDSMILKWELGNILNFSDVPHKMELNNNRVLNLDTDEEYMLDIFCTGTANTNDKIQSVSLVSMSNIGSSYRKMKTYDYESYVKNINENINKKGTMTKKKVVGLQNLFNQLCAIKNSNELVLFPSYKAVITGSSLVFEMGNRLYITKADRIAECKDLAHNIEIQTVQGNKVYFLKTKKINDKINKETVYCYNISDGLVRVCKIQFTY